MILPMTAPGDRHVADAAITAVEQQFAVMFTRVRSSQRDRAARVHPDLQPLAYTMIRQLVRQGPTRAGVLAEQLALDKSIVSRQAAMLEEIGFIERGQDDLDRRAWLLSPTPVAIERVNEVMSTDQARLHESLRDWEVRDVEKLAELLSRLNELV